MGIDILIKPFAIDALLEKARALTNGASAPDDCEEHAG
jgi:hypothetical protein